MDRTASTGADAAQTTERLDADEAGTARAASLIRAGRLVAFPTETVYGLGADGRNAAAVARLYAAKGRPRFNPLIAHVADAGSARRIGRFDARAERLAAAFWPGPLTLVLPLAPACDVSDLARAGLDSVAIRVPDHPVARRILVAAACPVVAPSANLSGRISPTVAAHVLGDLDGRIAAVVEGGPTRVGVESTIVALLDGRAALLRPGGLAREAIEAVLGGPLAISDDGEADAPRAPGALASHYAPRARMRLGATDIRPGEAALTFGPDAMPGETDAAMVLELSHTGDLTEAAARLFGHLHRLDASGADVIAVAPIPRHGLGEAINDRLDRAAADR